MKYPILMLFLALTQFACFDSTDPTTLTGSSRAAVMDVPGVVPGKYFVVLKGEVSDVDGASHALATAHATAVDHVFQRAFRGFTATLTAADVETLRLNPLVERITPEHYLIPASVEWGLDRIDQRNLPLDGAYQRNRRHGTGVRVYVLDGGIRSTHSEFQNSSGSRVVQSRNFLPNTTDLYCTDPTVPDGAHGTHVAAIIGGKSYGVADSVSLYSLRVLSCEKHLGEWSSSPESSAVRAIEWILNQYHTGPRVANLSFYVNNFTSEVNTAVQNLIASGVTVVVASGNTKGDACLYSPVKLDTVIAVGSTTAADAMQDLSADGACVEIFAPGESIESAGHTADNANATMTGNSQSTAFVSGAVALYLQDYPNASPLAVRDAVVNAATAGVLSGFRRANTPNRLLYALRPSPVSTTITGPTSITVKGTYTFTSNETGYLSPSREWKECYAEKLGDCNWNTAPVIGTQGTLGRVLSPDCAGEGGMYFIYVKVTDSDALSSTDTHSVRLCGPLAPVGE